MFYIFYMLKYILIFYKYIILYIFFNTFKKKEFEKEKGLFAMMTG